MMPARAPGRRRAAGIVVAAYCLYVAVPHFALLHHTHEGGGRPHEHGFLGAHAAGSGVEDAARASVPDPREIFGSLVQGPSLPPGFSEPDPSVAPTPGVHERAHRAAGEQGLRAPEHVAHSHFTQDPNLLALGTTKFLAIFSFAALPRRETSSVAPPHAAAPRAAARAPPRGA